MTKEELKMTKEELKMTNEELKMTKEELKAKCVQLEREMLSTKDDLITTKDDLLSTKDDLKAKDVQLEREVSFLKDPPFTFACGAHSANIHISSRAISYTTLLYSSTNVAGPHGLDISTGVFTAGHPGSYTATWSLYNGNAYAVNIYLRKNGNLID